MIIGVFLFLTLCLILSAVLFRKDFCTPAFLFTAGFWISCFWVVFFKRDWTFTSQSLPYLVCGGVLSFILGCLVVRPFEKKKVKGAESRYLQPINISGGAAYKILAIQITLFLITFWVIYRNTRTFNLILASGLYYRMNKYGRLTYYSGTIKMAQYVNFGLMYLIEYSILYNIIYKRKNKISSYFLLLFSLLITLLQGNRTTFFMAIISGVVMYYILLEKKNGGKENINISTFLKAIIFIIVLGILLTVTLTLTGRNTGEYTAIETISAYLGAPLKNLDMFLNEGHHNTGYSFGIETFIQFYHKIYGDNSDKIPNLYTYRWIGTEGLGNVYTTLMPLFYDFGIFGSCITLLILGVMFELLYYLTRRTNKRIIVILYSYSAFAISFSFFSNKIFELVISTALIYVFIGYLLVVVLCDRLSIAGRKIVIHRSSRNRHARQEVF